MTTFCLLKCRTMDCQPTFAFSAQVWPDNMSGEMYFLLGNLLCCYLLPLILISMCYILIWVKVSRRNIPSDSKDAQMERMQQKSKVKVIIPRRSRKGRVCYVAYPRAQVEICVSGFQERLEKGLGDTDISFSIQFERGTLCEDTRDLMNTL